MHSPKTIIDDKVTQNYFLLHNTAYAIITKTTFILTHATHNVHKKNIRDNCSYICFALTFE